MLKPEEAFHFRWQFYCIATRFASKYMDAIGIAKLMSRYQMQYIGVCVIVMSNTPHCRFEQNPSKYKIQIRKFMQMVYMYKKVSFEFENQDFVKMMQLEAMIMQAIHKRHNQVYWTCKRHGERFQYKIIVNNLLCWTQNRNFIASFWGQGRDVWKMLQSH